jgi:hypothetical protein
MFKYRRATAGCYTSVLAGCRIRLGFPRRVPTFQTRTVYVAALCSLGVRKMMERRGIFYLCFTHIIKYVSYITKLQKSDS